MPRYTDWNSLPTKYVEEIARLRVLEQARAELGLNSGGAMGAITWDTSYKLAGAFTNPATGQVREITFRRDAAGSVWREVSRTAADQAV